MWAADTMGSLRGGTCDVIKPGIWKFDPHAVVSISSIFLSDLSIYWQVPFQPNQHDCGMYTLWHLKHILEFGRIREDGCIDQSLCFGKDMVGKRLRLAHELITESAYH